MSVNLNTEHFYYNGWHRQHFSPGEHTAWYVVHLSYIIGSKKIAWDLMTLLNKYLINNYHYYRVQFVFGLLDQDLRDETHVWVHIPCFMLQPERVRKADIDKAEWQHSLLWLFDAWTNFIRTFAPVRRSSFEVGCFERSAVYTMCTHGILMILQRTTGQVCHAEVALIVCRWRKYLRNDSRAFFLPFFPSSDLT